MVHQHSDQLGLRLRANLGKWCPKNLGPKINVMIVGRLRPGPPSISSLHLQSLRSHSGINHQELPILMALLTLLPPAPTPGNASCTRAATLPLLVLILTSSSFILLLIRTAKPQQSQVLLDGGWLTRRDGGEAVLPKQWPE